MSDQLLQQLTTLRKEYFVLQSELEQVSQQINLVQRDLRSKCTHEWEIDDSDRGGRTHHTCTMCGEYR